MTTEIQETSEITQSISGPFRPGYDPRRNVGRPRKGMTFAEIAAALPIESKQAVVHAQLERATKHGDTRAAEYLRDTAEGRPAQRVEVTDTTVADALRSEVLAALAKAGAISYVDAEYTELPTAADET
jgi:hypothetical protein